MLAIAATEATVREKDAVFDDILLISGSVNPLTFADIMIMAL